MGRIWEGMVLRGTICPYAVDFPITAAWRCSSFRPHQPQEAVAKPAPPLRLGKESPSRVAKGEMIRPPFSRALAGRRKSCIYTPPLRSFNLEGWHDKQSFIIDDPVVSYAWLADGARWLE
jgi:hypothetical protein